MAKNKPLIIFGKHQFVAEEEDEIEFQTGDPILVLEKDEEFNDGWWKGRTMSGEVGLFPVNFTTTENIFNVNINSLIEASRTLERTYVPNIIDEDSNYKPLVSPFGTFNNSLSLNSEDGIRRSLSKSAESTNSSGFENRPSSPNGSVSSMRALSSPRMSASLPNNFRLMGGDLGRMPSDASKYKNLSQNYTHSQPIMQQHFSQSQQSQSSESRINSSQNHIKKPQDWSVDEVCEWLMSINCDKIISSIKENEITGDKLLDLNLSKLREYGIHSLSERIELLHEILTLREEYSENKPLFNSFNNSNASSYTSDYESYSGSIKYNNSNNKIHKQSSNFSISEYYGKSDNAYESDQKMAKSLTSIDTNSRLESSEKRHHELPVTPNIYTPPEVSNSTVNSNLNNSYGGGMVGIAGISMGVGTRNRSLSLQDEPLHSGLIQPGHLPRSISISTPDRYGNKSNLDFKNAEYKGWLYVRFDDEMGWKKRWVVLLDNRMYILNSPDNVKNTTINTLAPEVLLTLELDPTYKVLPDNNDSSREHNFLLQDPRLGGIHLAADDQLGVVTWINYLVRACTNTQKKPTPLIPLKNIGRQAREPLLSNQAVSSLTYEKDQESSYPTIYENQSVDFSTSGPKRKNSINMSINGILSPNLESEYAYSIKNGDDDTYMDHSSILKNRTNSIISNTFPSNPISPISATQTAAAAANGWFRTNAKSATDYSNYRNLQQVSQETRLQLQKTAKLADPVIMTPILKANKVKSFNPNQIDPDDEFSLNENSGMMSFLSNKSDYHGSKKNIMNGVNSSMANKHNSVSSSFVSYSHNNFGTSSQVSPIEMMERRGIGSFITNNQTKKMNKKPKKNSILFW